MNGEATPPIDEDSSFVLFVSGIRFFANEPVFGKVLLSVSRLIVVGRQLHSSTRRYSVDNSCGPVNIRDDGMHAREVA